MKTCTHTFATFRDGEFCVSCLLPRLNEPTEKDEGNSATFMMRRRPWCFDGKDHRYNDGECECCSQSARPPWAETWMQVAWMMAARSYDPRLQVGAIIVSEDNTQMLSVGFNGNYKGGPHEHESTEPGKSGFIHAEINALVKCDFNIHKKKNMYVTHSPCRDCAKLIINAEIARVTYDIPYRDPSGLYLLRCMGIEVMSVEEAILNAKVR